MSKNAMRRFPGRCLLVIAVLFVCAAGAWAANPGSLEPSEMVDDRLGLFDEMLRVWKVPRRYTAGRSPYFQPGLPPYRQQPEKAEDQVPVEPEPEIVATPGPSEAVPAPRAPGVVDPPEASSSSDSGSSGAGGANTGGSGDGGDGDVDFPGSIGY